MLCICAMLMSSCGDKIDVTHVDDSTLQQSTAELQEPGQSVTGLQVTEQGKTESQKTASSCLSEQVEIVYVFVCGAVKTPGVYSLESNARINDALMAAGGYEEEADTEQINLADFVYDGQMIYFPKKGEIVPQTHADIQSGKKPAESAEDGGKVNINSATKEELMSLPGIGEAKAERIVAYRTESGPFLRTEDIMQVTGIGEKLYEQLQDYITVN